MILVLSALVFTLFASEQSARYEIPLWISDNRDGTYTNPVIDADYSDADVIRVGDDFYLTASSFNCIPGLPILHSKDLVNWKIIGHALKLQPPPDVFARPQHGNGVWAPAIRFHNNHFYIFYGDPDFGIYMVKARVTSYRKPKVGGKHPVEVPATTDEFETKKLSLQWQWHANPLEQWLSFSARPGRLRLPATSLPENAQNLWVVPNLLLQKLPARSFTVTTFVDASQLLEGERSGLLMMGRDYSYLAVIRRSNNLQIIRVTCIDAPKGKAEKEDGAVDLNASSLYLRITVTENANCEFSYSIDGRGFESLGNVFAAQPGLWIGAKVGLFSLAPAGKTPRGYADYDWFRFESLQKAQKS